MCGLLQLVRERISMNKQTYTAHSAKDMRAFGARISARLKGGDVVLLEGNLGAGKTQCAQGVARALGITKSITSPTFTLMNVYKVPAAKGRAHHITHLVHIDLYRLKTADEAYAIGIMDYIGEPSTLTLIEWPEKIKNTLPVGSVRAQVNIKTLQKNKRLITISSYYPQKNSQ